MELGGRNRSLYWIGLTDSQVEDHFVWQTSGKEVSYTNWDNGEPDGDALHQQDCVHLELDHMTWSDIDCKMSNLDALCQIGKLLDTQL